MFKLLLNVRIDANGVNSDQTAPTGVLRIIAYLGIRHLKSSRSYQKIQCTNHKTGGCCPIIMTEGHELIEESTIGSMGDSI